MSVEYVAYQHEGETKFRMEVHGRVSRENMARCIKEWNILNTPSEPGIDDYLARILYERANRTR